MNTQKKTALLMRQLLLLIALLAAALPAYSYFEYNGLFYLVNSGTQKTVTVAKSFYEGYYKGNIVIPEIAIDDETNTSYTVTAINRNAFSNCRELTSVTIPNSVTYIGDSAFSGCSTLTSATIGDSVTSIPDYAFWDCDALASVTIGNSVKTIGFAAFHWCSALTSVTIGNSVKTIGFAAFYWCSALTSVTIGDSVTFISYGAFLYSPLQTIYCQPYNPPTLEWKDGEGRPDPPFSNSVYDNAMLYVPSGCKSKYAEYAVSWGFHNIKEMDSGVEDVASEEAVIHVVDGSIVIDGVADDVPVEVYDMTGKAVYSGAAAEIPAMPRGIYIVRIGSKAVKVAV